MNQNRKPLHTDCDILAEVNKHQYADCWLNYEPEANAKQTVGFAKLETITQFKNH